MKQNCHHIHSLKELEKEIHTLKTGLGELRTEVSYHHDNPSYEPDDKFMVVMEPFLEEATQSFEKMEKTKVEMEEKVVNNIQCRCDPCDLLFISTVQTSSGTVWGRSRHNNNS